MRQELDDALCSAFPKLFQDRHKSMQETCMCWGFDHGDGWYGILEVLCHNIQGHIDWKRQQRANALRYNRALKRAVRENSTAPLVSYLSAGLEGEQPWIASHAERLLATGGQMRHIPDPVTQVVVEQVKEKFGTLRFYYRGGDEMIAGMVRMAEALSARVCEYCGAPAKCGGDRWITTMCDSCRSKTNNR